MTHLRKMMLEELERRNYTAGTIRHYLRFVEPQRLPPAFHQSPHCSQSEKCLSFNRCPRKENI